MSAGRTTFTKLIGPVGSVLSSGSFLHGFHSSFSCASDYVTTASSTFFPICYSLIILPSYAKLFERLTVLSFLKVNRYFVHCGSILCEAYVAKELT